MSKKKEAEKSKKTKRIKEIVSILHKYEITKGLTPEKLRLVISDLGPTYIKMGQILSMREDLIPKEYCIELAKLQSNVNPLTYDEIISILKEEYKTNPYEIFESIEEKPLGSASIAQVHKAKLKNSNEEVVIKVQRPNIYSTMQSDMKLLIRASRMIKHVAPKVNEVIDLEEVLTEMWNAAKQEMNFLVEANNAEQFAKLNRNVKYVESPIIYKDYTTDKVLVMNYIPGYEIDQREELIKNGIDVDKVAKRLSTNYIKQVIHDGFFHADPHPGNIRIVGENIGWIDLGMMGTLSSHERNQLNKAIKAIAYNNTEDLKSAFLQIGKHTQKIDDTRLYEQLDEIVNEYIDLDINDINLGQFIEEILAVCTENHISMPSDITLLARGIVALESVITELSPNSSLLKIMTAYVLEDKEPPDLEKEVINFSRKLKAFADKTLQIPVSINELTSMILKGHTKINLELTGSEKPLAAISKMVNRLVFGIIIAALLIGSSFLTTTNMSPKILGIPALGFIGYVISLILGLWIIVQMFIQDRNLDKK